MLRESLTQRHRATVTSSIFWPRQADVTSCHVLTCAAVAEAAAPAAPPAAAAAAPAAPGAAPAAPGGDPFLAVCRWWDRECAGYLRAEDVEEVLLYTADFISRARPAPPNPPQDDASRFGRASCRWASRQCCARAQAL